ncbi:MAG: Asp-tRNA(Asn)/Glu-tRNA(Gln) amidotransferase subunit GatA, partial [Dehalococcoidia bacterium]|nr:Asp-tRNA(Asn)/Glu-tRNA(Gln) amidotransferase subunit GatA [Dehalococcoidia bacterium]
MNKLCQLTIHQAHELLKRREISSVELTKATLERIAEIEDKIHAYVTITEDIALKQAEEADDCIRSGNITPLTGVPVLIKDVMCTKGIRT